MKSKKILITGGSGFIGAKLTERLISLGNNPYLLVRNRKEYPKKRLSALLHKVHLFEGDLTEHDKLEKIIKKIKPQIIFHLAGEGVYTYADYSYGNIISIIDSNIKGTINLFQACQKTGCEVFINTGSCFEYGSRNSPFKEDSALLPCNIYGASRVSTTLLAQIFFKNFYVPTVTLRPFTVYGPGEDSRRFISTVIRQCLRGENPKLPKSKIIRDYIFIDDVIEAYLLAYKHKKKLFGEIINISTGKGSTLSHVTQKIAKLTGAKGIQPEIGAFPSRAGEVLSLVGNPDKAKQLLGWKAKYSLEEGLQKTIDWVKAVG